MRPPEICSPARGSFPNRNDEPPRRHHPSRTARPFSLSSRPLYCYTNQAATITQQQIISRTSPSRLSSTRAADFRSPRTEIRDFVIHSDRLASPVFLNMCDFDNDARSCSSEYATPPLSPSKTISTAGWSSPVSPISPHKSQSCLGSHVCKHSDCIRTHLKPAMLADFASHLASLQPQETPRFSHGDSTQSLYDDPPKEKALRLADQVVADHHDPSFLPVDRLSSKESSPWV